MIGIVKDEDILPEDNPDKILSENNSSDKELVKQAVTAFPSIIQDALDKSQYITDEFRLF